MKIIVALDESQHSERALEFVARMRWPAGSSTIVLCVAQPIGLAATSTYEGPAFPPELIEAQHLRVQETVAHAEQALRASGQSTVGRVYDGDPREAIVQAAERERADLLVLGSHGRSGLAKMMLGSVSSYVVTHAPCSVLVVKGPRTPAAAHHHGGES